MLVNTKPFGEIEVDDRQRIKFPHGILGFEDIKEYVIINAEQEPFFWLQSIEVQDTAFVLINPDIFRQDYSKKILQEIGETGKQDPENFLIFAIVTIPSEHKEMTANLQGPILIDRKNKTGIQMISDNPEWNVRHKILDEMKGTKTC